MKIFVISGLMGCGKTTISHLFDKNKTIVLHIDDFYRKSGFHREKVLGKIILEVENIKNNYKNIDKSIIIEGFMNKNDLEKCHSLGWHVFISDFSIEESLSVRKDLKLTKEEYKKLLDENKF